MNKLLRLILLISISIVINSCEDAIDSEVFFEQQIMSVQYGTSFGECDGYCINSIDINETEIIFTSSSWDKNDDLTDIQIKLEITKESWELLTQEIDFLAFRNMEEVIGCPDCDDSGSEWVKIVNDGISHKVTFEYHNVPEKIEDLVEELRFYFDKFAEYENLEIPEGFELMYLRNYSDVDGCSLLFESIDGKLYQAINLDDFDFDINDGKIFFIKHEKLFCYQTECMVGEIVNIVDIIDPNES